MEKSFAFWGYDQFPYVLGSAIVGPIAVKNGDARAYSPNYMGNVHVQHQMTEEDGLELLQKLQVLEEEFHAQNALIHKQYLQAALTLAPFLKNFPAYEGVK
jgi:hypothetical protein